MKRIFSILLFLLPCVMMEGRSLFDDSLLSDRTLRVDYIFSGTAVTCQIALDGLSVSDGWFGRRVNMDSAPVRGNGRIEMRCAADGEVLYVTTFSTLFQEWQATEEAVGCTRSFENVFLLPMPSVEVDIRVELYDFHGRTASSFTHRVKPDDILIRNLPRTDVRSEYVHMSGDSREKIDVAIVAEGYSEAEMDIFLDDAAAAVDAILSHEPFASSGDNFNFIAVAPVSKDSGVSIPHLGVWKDTALESHFDTFYSERYLTTLRLSRLHDLLSGIPYEHIIILANTDNYGGGGIFGSYTLTTAHHKAFRPVVVHEFGHSFGGLADEYFYDDQYTEYYYPGVEPWEQNITTMADFHSKWEDMLGKDGVGVHEGGGYQSKGVWRACDDCRMRTNGAPDFCPVCIRAVSRIIDFQTKEQRNKQ